MPKKTYAQARKAILEYLKSEDWDLSLPTLKVPYATSPDKTIRLWFKPQAVHFTESDRGIHRFSDARSLMDIDYREMSPADFLKTVMKSFGRNSSSIPPKRSLSIPPKKHPTNPPKSKAVEKVSSGLGVTAEKRRLRAEIREKRRTVIPRLRELVKHARRARTERLRRCKRDCKEAERKARKTAIEARRKLERHILKTKKRASEICSSCKVVDDKSVDALKQKVDALNVEMKEFDALKKRVGSLRSERGRKGGQKAAELKSESDSAVIFNLGDNEELIALFKKIRGKIKATKHMSRTEAFFEYVHNHPEALEELRSKREHKWERDAEKMFAERQPPPCLERLDQCQRELDELKSAEKFLSEAESDVPF